MNGYRGFNMSFFILKNKENNKKPYGIIGT